MFLTLIPTCYLAIIDRSWGGPLARLPPIAIEFRNKDERKVWDVLNLTIPDFTALGQILNFPRHVKQKILLFW